MAEREIVLGRTRKGRTVTLDAKTRASHMHIIGAFGRGKSKFIEYLIRQDIEAQAGLCLIDPHGYLYDEIVRWCTRHKLQERRKIVLFEPSVEGWAFGFNPLNFGASSRELAFCVDSMVKACAQVWGGEDTTRTPLLKRCLRSIFHVLAEKQYTLLEALPLIDPQDIDGLRRYLTHDLKDYVFKQQWENFNRLALDGRPREFEDVFSSTINRMIEFLASETIRFTIGQLEQVLDFRTAMDEGYIILVNLASGGVLSDDNARLLGSLIVNDLFLKARGRPKNSPPFYLYIDECSLFINEDCGRILDEARKFNLSLVLAHQHLSQLKQAGEKVYGAVMTNAQTKVVFGGLSPEDARVMADLCFIGEYDLNETKPSTKRPVVWGYKREWFESYAHSSAIAEGEHWAHTDSESETDSHTTGRVESETTGSGRTKSATSGSGTGTNIGLSGPSTSGGMPLPPTDYSAGESTFASKGEGIADTENTTSGVSEVDMHSTATTRGSSDTHGESRMRQQGETVGRSEREVAQLKMVSEQYSLEEQVYRSMAIMVNQPAQQAVVKIPGQWSARLQTETIEEFVVRDEAVERFKRQVLEQTHFARLVDEACEEIGYRQQALAKAALAFRQEEEITGMFSEPTAGRARGTRRAKAKAARPAVGAAPAPDSGAVYE